MNASVESIPVTPRAPAALRAAPDAPAPVREGVLEIPGALSLYHGGRLSDARIAWRLVGAAHAPVVCALGGISANRRVCLTEDPREGEDPRQGWWSEVVGPGGALDTHSFRVLGFDYIGGSGDSTGPQPVVPAPAGAFPSISSYDQAEALVRLLDHLGVKSLAAIAGGSYGGMVGLAFAERFPERVSRLITIGAADRSHPLATAWRSVQRHIVSFAAACGQPQEGLRLARALAMTTYRSPEELAARFSGAVARDGQRYRAESFLCLSVSIDLHRVDAARVFVPTTVVAIREDQLVPLADLRALAARLPRGHVQEISSIYGHDAFLKESHQLRGIFRAAVGSAP